MTERARPPTFRIHLSLGRVSNVPTVWSNVLCGWFLAGGALDGATMTLLGVAMSSLYVGGMYLNDAFDRHIDAKERKERPIPAGHIDARRVFAIGFGLLAAGVVLVTAATLGRTGSAGAVASSIALGGAIVLYDVWHKQNPLSPLLMGLCRVLVYCTAGLASGGALGLPFWGGTLALLGHLIGLTFIAKQENLDRFQRFWPLGFLAAPFFVVLYLGTIGVVSAALALGLIACLATAIRLLRTPGPGRIPRAVGLLIAAVSLVDALLIASLSSVEAGLIAALGFPATLAAQRFVAGT